MNIPFDTQTLIDEVDRRKAIEAQSQYGRYDGDGKRQGGLIAFVRYFWPVLEPDAPFVDGWPLWAMCEHLEAITRGDITRLLVNVPPGFMKSMLTNIFWPAWEWGAMGHSSYRYVCFSYSASLTERDNDKFRVLVASERYQALYGPVRIEAEKAITLENKTITKVKNVRTGWKLASSVGGVGTGERGDRVIIDDPHNVVESESEIVRGETIRWFRESVSSRLNNLDTGAIVVIGQRVHQYDVSGIIQSQDFDYEHLMIPWELDRDRVVDEDGKPFETAIGWYDPRLDEEDGEREPAWLDRFSERAMDRTRLEIGPYAWAAQYQQSPAPRGGGIFKRHWWKPWESSDGRYPLFSYVIASLDVAVTEKAENNPSGFTVWGIFQPEDGDNPAIMLIDAWRKRLNMHGDPAPRIITEIPQIGDDKQTVINRNVAWKRRTSEGWGLVEWVAYTCRVRCADLLLIECEKGGIVAAQEMQRLYGGENWSVHLQPVKGDKHARAMAVVPTFSQGKVYAPDKDWAEMVIDEMEAFPKHRYDDLTDSTTQAIRYFRNAGLTRTDEEIQAEAYERIRHKPQQRPLYPC